MKTLDTLETGTCCRVVKLSGDNRFLGRVISMGITPGCIIQILHNKGKQTLLVYARNTMIAIARKESKNIIVENM